MNLDLIVPTDMRKKKKKGSPLRMISKLTQIKKPSKTLSKTPPPRAFDIQSRAPSSVKPVSHNKINFID